MKKLLFIMALFCLLFSSCKKDQIIDAGKTNQEKVGRFDHTPFKWDYQSNPNNTKVFIGDLKLGTNSSGNSNIYPGAVYPKSTIDDFTFANEYPYEKNLYDYYFDFSRKFIVEDLFHQYGRGLKEYFKAEEQALTSQQFKGYIGTTEAQDVEFNSVEAYTYSDVEKSFLSNSSFGKIFTSKMSQNKKGTKYKSIYFARLESSFFEVVFEPDNRNFFFDAAINNDLKSAMFPALLSNREFQSSNNSINFKNGRPLYIRNMSYGNYAFLAIESEYSFAEVKKAIEGTFNLWKINAKSGTTYDLKTGEILSKSSVTLMISKASSTNNATESYWETSLDKLIDIVKVRFTENYIGTPIFVEIKDIKDNSIYNPIDLQ